MSVITLIGGHGKVALRTTPLLTDAGHTVASMIRNPEQSGAIDDAGASPVVADVEQHDTDALAELLAGSDAIIWCAGAGGSGPKHTWGLDRDAAIRTIDAAAQAGVSRFIMVSYFNSMLEDGEVPGVEPEDDMYAYFNAKSQADEHLRNSKLDWTIIGPSALTLDEPTNMVTVDTSGQHGAADVPTTSRANVAAMIAAALDEPASIGTRLFFYDGDTPVAQAVTQGN